MPIADIASCCRVRTCRRSGVGIEGLPQLRRWMDAMKARPACPRGVAVPFKVASAPKDEQAAQAFIERARHNVWDTHAHTGDPDRDIKQKLVRFGYVLRKFGITSRGLGIAAHGLRHEALIEEYIAITGQEPPLRGGGEGLTREREEAARLAVSRLAGHNRGRASAACLGAVLHKKKRGTKGGAGGGAAGGDAAA